MPPVRSRMAGSGTGSAVSLQTVLAEIEPAWLTAEPAQPIPFDLLARARSSALGERILARWLLAGHGAALLAPNPQREVGLEAVQWPRPRLAPLIRDTGILALAPAIRAEVGRDAVRQLKSALGSGYLLALDRTIWDGRPVNPPAAIKLAERMMLALRRSTASFVPLHALLDHQGRCELRHWGMQHNPAFGQWVALAHAPEQELPTMLPPAQVELLYRHHADKGRQQADTVGEAA